MSTHYAILSLPPPNSSDHSSISPETIKFAYRRALLNSHPDKKTTASHPPSTPTSSLFSIDQITQAYKTLSNPATRLLYDQSLLVAPSPAPTADGAGDKERFSGLESVDLDDMDFDEERGFWYRGCRCGRKRGYGVTEGDLEDGLDDSKEKGEVLVGCAGCSLGIRVGYGVGSG